MNWGNYGHGMLQMGHSRRPLLQKDECGNRKYSIARVSLHGIREDAWGMIVANGVRCREPRSGLPSPCSSRIGLHLSVEFWCFSLWDQGGMRELCTLSCFCHEHILGTVCWLHSRQKGMACCGQNYFKGVSYIELSFFLVLDKFWFINLYQL